jgi:diphthine-ammonia ligase
VYVAGQIALCPASMKIIEGGITAESRLSLRHVQRVLAAMHPGLLLHNVTVAICYVTSASYIPEAVTEWERALKNEVWKIIYYTIFMPTASCKVNLNLRK